MKYLVTNILITIFAILLIGYLLLRFYNEKTISSTERLLSFKYREFKYFLVALVVFIALSIFVYRIEKQYIINQEVEKEYQIFIKIVKKLIQTQTDFGGGEDSGRQHEEIVRLNTNFANNNENKLTDFELDFLKQMEYIVGSENKTIQNLLKNAQYNLLMKYINNEISIKDKKFKKSDLREVVCNTAGTCLLTAVSAPASPIIALANLARSR